jgi:hypothetical protein
VGWVINEVILKSIAQFSNDSNMFFGHSGLLYSLLVLERELRENHMGVVAIVEEYLRDIQKAIVTVVNKIFDNYKLIALKTENSSGKGNGIVVKEIIERKAPKLKDFLNKEGSYIGVKGATGITYMLMKACTAIP